MSQPRNMSSVKNPVLSIFLQIKVRPSYIGMTPKLCLIKCFVNFPMFDVLSFSCIPSQATPSTHTVMEWLGSPNKDMLEF